MTTTTTDAKIDAPLAAIVRDNGHARRINRAYSQEMTVIALFDQYGHATGLYDVYSESGSRYVVDLNDQTCSCPDVEAHDPSMCKHRARVLLQVHHTALPKPGEEPSDDYYGGLYAEARELRARIEGRKERGYPLGALPNLLAPITAALNRL
jgi:hypothetical protein